MNTLKKMREDIGVSHRQLAQRAGVSYKSLQLIEKGDHDPRLSTLDAIASALDYPEGIIRERVSTVFSEPPDSLAMIAHHLAHEGEESWKTWLFNFVDAFRARRDERYITNPTCEEISPSMKALLTSTTETLCDELALAYPW